MSFAELRCWSSALDMLRIQTAQPVFANCANSWLCGIWWIAIPDRTCSSCPYYHPLDEIEKADPHVISLLQVLMTGFLDRWSWNTATPRKSQQLSQHQNAGFGYEANLTEDGQTRIDGPFNHSSPRILFNRFLTQLSSSHTWRRKTFLRLWDLCWWLTKPWLRNILICSQSQLRTISQKKVMTKSWVFVLSVAWLNKKFGIRWQTSIWIIPDAKRLEQIWKMVV